MAEADLHPLIAYGSFNALLLAPYFTDGCITTLNEGLEVSATSPYEQLLKKELSQTPYLSLQNLPYGRLDVARGVDHLQLLGRAYYAAYTSDARRQADADPRLSGGPTRARGACTRWPTPRSSRRSGTGPRSSPASASPAARGPRSASTSSSATRRPGRSRWWPRALATGRGSRRGTTPAQRTKDGLVVLGSTVDVEAPRRAGDAGTGEQHAPRRRRRVVRRRPPGHAGAGARLLLPQLAGDRRTRARGAPRPTSWSSCRPPATCPSTTAGPRSTPPGSALSLFGAAAVVGLAWADRARGAARRRCRRPPPPARARSPRHGLPRRRRRTSSARRDRVAAAAAEAQPSSSTSKRST